MATISTSSSRADDSGRSMKRRKIEPEDRDRERKTSDQIRWRSLAEQQTYSSKLVEALRNVGRGSATQRPVNAYSRTRAVRETADRLLAVAAKGRTRWSRAILTSRLKIRLMNHKKAKVRSSKKAAEGGRRATNPAVGVWRKKRLPALQRRFHDLGRLVPGCRKLPLSNLLEETTDYIAALEMQVRAMAALADLLTVRAGAGNILADSTNRLAMS
ncbi:hypothetical protein Dimus_021651 [Dionaea muscipula]